MEVGINSKEISDWMDNDLQSFLRFLPPLKHKLYSSVAKRLTEYGCNKVLDYGCGEGNQMAFLNNKLEVDLYDINKSFSFSAYNKYKESFELLNLVEDAKLFRKSVYDAVIVNMVWMCLKDKAEINLLLDNLLKIKKDDGIILLSITNPYSRELEFSYYETEYSKNEKTFNYANNGEAFDVFIKNEPKTIFTDFHWTMEFTFKTLFEKKLELEEFIELKDETFNGYSNPKIPPYILLILK